MAKDKQLLWKISDKLIAARGRANVTQEQLAEAVGLQPNSIHRYEAGDREMGFITAISLAQALHISVEELVPDELAHNDVRSTAEKDLVDLFFQMDETDQKAIMRQMAALIYMKKTA